MTPGQTHPRRRGLNELMESVAAKLAERPDHIAAARVLEEMQADAAKISHKADGVDVKNGQPEVSSSSSSSSSSSLPPPFPPHAGSPTPPGPGPSGSPPPAEKARKNMVPERRS